MSKTHPLSVLILAHDVDDPAIARRAAMLCQGGASVTIAGFRRQNEQTAIIAGCPVTHLGRTHNAAFLRRIVSVMSGVFRLSRHKTLFENADVIWARNLEMLALAVRGRSLAHGKPSIVYECLDIHRLLTRRDTVGVLLRKTEGWLAQRASLLVTSSPAFIENYFKPLSTLHLPIHLVENKVFPALASLTDHKATEGAWKIGWFGILRCEKSLSILKNLAQKSGGKVEIIIRGRPAPDLFDDFQKRLEGIPNIRFEGSYKNPEDMEEIYSGVHFVWAIDFFEEGLNSAWLLPNRLYEGGAFGAIPLALRDSETGRFLIQRNLGVVMGEPLEPSLISFFQNLLPATYQDMKEALCRVPRKTWETQREECEELVVQLQKISSAKKGGCHV